MHSPVSMTLAKQVFSGVNETSEACHRCRWHRWRHASPVSLIPGSKYRQLRRCQWHQQCMHCWCRWHCSYTSRTFGSSPMPLKEQSVRKQAISRYYFSIVSIQSSKESSNYDKIVCFAGVNDTGEALEKSIISANIWKKSKSLLGLSTWGQEKLFEEKNQRWKIWWHCPFNNWVRTCI